MVTSYTIEEMPYLNFKVTLYSENLAFLGAIYAYTFNQGGEVSFRWWYYNDEVSLTTYRICCDELKERGLIPH